MKAYEPNQIRFRYWDEMEQILNYLNNNGQLNITPQRVEKLYEKYSDDVWCAGWMSVSNEILESFANWLSEIEVDEN